MSVFKAEFNYSPELSFAPSVITFDNVSKVGQVVIDDTITFIDSDDNLIDNVPQNIIVARIEKTKWEFGDGTISIDTTNVQKEYKLSGNYDVTLRIYSEEIYNSNTGDFFRVCSSITKTIKIDLLTIAWLKSHMTQPHAEAYEQNSGFKDLIDASSRLFDRMYKDIYDISQINDVEACDPKFLKYYSETLNHAAFYAKKIGFNEQTEDNFIDYNFFDRVETGAATDLEINNFRKFLINTINHFKQKGSVQQIEDFYKLFGIIVQLKEMWTENFETLQHEPLLDSFIFEDKLKNSKNNFSKDVSVTGWDNSLGQFIETDNELIIDTYHYVTQHSYPVDAFETSGCEAKFYINDIIPNIIGVNLSDGKYIGENIDDCTTRSTECTESSLEKSCLENSIKIQKNENYFFENQIVDGVSCKIWKAPLNYIESIYNVFGLIPNDERERDEIGIVGDTSDDYFWANWDTGVTIPQEIIGIGEYDIRTPNVETVLPFVNYSSSQTDSNLFKTSLVNIDTSSDIFVVLRGLINVDIEGYYNFELSLGNSINPTNLSKEHVGLFNLKNSSIDLDSLQKNPVAAYSFNRSSSTDVLETVNNIPLTTKLTEYGLIEIRQNESYGSSDWKYLEKGLYPFEIIATYGSYSNKQLKLSWECWTIDTLNNFVQQISKQIIPQDNLLTYKLINDTIENRNGVGILSVNKDTINYGDKIVVAYSTPNIDTINKSGFISKNKFKDLEIEVVLTPKNSFVSDDASVVKTPRNDFELLFRGISRNKDPYASIDTYYALVYSGKNSEFYLSQVSYDLKTNSTHYKNIALDKSTTGLIFAKTYLDESGHTQYLEDNTYYNVKVIVKDNLVSAYIAKNTDYSLKKQNIKTSADVQSVIEPDSITYTTIFENVDINVDDSQIKTTNEFNVDVLISEKYQAINESGTYGICVKNSRISIDDFNVYPYDFDDEKLYETSEKEKKIQSKYSRSKPDRKLYLNSYDESEKSFPTFKYILTENFTPSTNRFDLSRITLDENKIDRIYADNVIDTTSFTRLNINFDNDFLTTYYENTQNIVDTTFIQLGQFFEPIINLSNIKSNDENYFNYNPIISEKFRITPQTVYESDDQYNKLSLLNRINTHNLEIDDKLTTLIQTQQTEYLGLWEEVCPNSTDAIWSIDDETITNPVFSFVVNNSGDKIGVKIKSEEIYNKLICRYCVDEIVWGLYDVMLPHETNIVEIFIPIGKLNKDYYTYLPPIELFRGDARINLKGVYSHKNIDMVQFSTSGDITIVSFNPWEEDYSAKITCKYFLDVATCFVGKLKEINTNLNPSTSKCFVTINENDINCNPLKTGYIFESNLEKVYDYLKQNVNTFEENYNWWFGLTGNVWKQYPLDTLIESSELFSGTNEINGVELKYKTNKEIINGSKVVDLTWCYNTTGWDKKFTTSNEYDFTLFQNYNLSIDGIPLAIIDEKIITIGSNVNNFMNIDIGFNDIGSVIYGNSNVKTIGLYGLYNWFDAHGRNDYLINEENRLGWDISELNDEFNRCVKFNNVFIKVDPLQYQFNKFIVRRNESTIPANTIITISFNLSKFANNCPNSEEAPIEPSSIIVVGISNSLKQFYTIPPILQNVSRWVEYVDNIMLNNYTINGDMYTVNENTIIFDTQSNDLTIFTDSTLVSIIKNDALPEDAKVEKITYRDDFKNNRNINWSILSDDGRKFVPIQRLSDLELKYTSSVKPYSILPYKGEQCLKIEEKSYKNELQSFSGSNNDNNVVGIGSNEGSISPMFISDINSNTFTTSIDFIFDRDIVNYNADKHVELILKAQNNFDELTNQWGVTDYYFVGAGTYNFDVGLGMRSIDPTTKEVKETILMSWGEFNTRNIKIDTWYTLRAEVNTTTIKVYLNEKGKDPQLIINYNIDKKYEKFTERYLLGHFETLQKVIIGLESLGLTTPATLSDKTNEQYTFDNFKEEFASTLPINGFKSGFRVFNQYTYVSNYSISFNKPKVYYAGSAYDVKDLTNVINLIKQKYPIKSTAIIKKYDRSVDLYEYVQIDDELFIVDGTNIQKYKNIIDTFYVEKTYVIIVEKVVLNNRISGFKILESGEHEYIFDVLPKSGTIYINRPEDLFNFIPYLQYVRHIKNNVEYLTELDDDLNITGSRRVIGLGDTIILGIDTSQPSLINTGSSTSSFVIDGDIQLFDKTIKVYNTKMTDNIGIMVKDNTFYRDSIESYQEIADKKINKLFINDSRLHVIFEDNA